MPPPDDLQRTVYGVLGVPIDVVDMATVLQKINSAAADRSMLWISTINLNYLVASQSDPDFRRSLLQSDLCSADGVPIVWIARLLGIPIKTRIAGSDLFDVLGSAGSALKIFLFGGAENVAATVCQKINADSTGLVCVGSLYPGFGAVEEMSTRPVLEKINASNADVLAVALGASKGQAWLLQNQHRLGVPVRAHLGAALGFQAGTLRRAPLWLRQIGLEWAWRIWQEPKLWRRYMTDGQVFAQLLATRILPLFALRTWHALRSRGQNTGFRIERTVNRGSMTLSLYGFADANHVDAAIASFRAAAAENKAVAINFAGAQRVDARFIGLLLMLDKCLKGRDLELSFCNVPPAIRRFIHFSGFGFLLSSRVEKA
jgi:N-acetylglucosaminyldiphosphoundecaprenol N-acetyl-beta-D-mannosaminyltransferase